jgi:hypothetical protein
MTDAEQRCRCWRKVGPCLLAAGALLCSSAALAAPRVAGDMPPAAVVRAQGRATSPPLRQTLARESRGPVKLPPAARERSMRPLPRDQRALGIGDTDAARQTSVPQIAAPPSLGLHFEGISNQDNASVFGWVVPPDPNGDIGPNHYVQMVNLLVQVFNRSGTPLSNPFKLSSLFAPLGAPCGTLDNGDPIVLYDQLADRWLPSQFALPGNNSPPYYQCIAISQTGDPLGAYHLYSFLMPGDNLNDYPKFGVWPDGYYMTDNQFLNGSSWNGAGAFAFDRQKMLRGEPALGIYFDLGAVDPNIGGMLPSDVDGSIPPPPGTPNYFAYFIATEFGDSQDGLRIFEFSPDFDNPSNSTFTERTDSPVSVAAFNPVSPSGRSDIIQPSPGFDVDAITDRLMFRLAYRNFGTHESLVTNHSVTIVSSPYQAGVRYYELRRSLSGGTFTVPEQATFAPDNKSRWMGSVAMDHQGNLAVGYSLSSSTTFPSIAYAGRLASDPPNQLAQGEAIMIAGTGVQTDTSSRWGDYSAMTVDPVDDCTFWYTTEYYTAAGQASSSRGWQTRIGKFKFDSCTPAPQGTLQGTVTDCSSALPLSGVFIEVSSGFSQVTGTNGQYSRPLAPGTYGVTASKTGYPTQPCRTTWSTRQKRSQSASPFATSARWQRPTSLPHCRPRVV